MRDHDMPKHMYIYIYIHIHAYITLHYITLHYITLQYITLHCITLHYITIHCIALHYITIHYNTLHCITLHYNTLHCIALHCIALHCITLHCITLHYIALHYITLHTSHTLHIYIYTYIYIHTVFDIWTCHGLAVCFGVYGFIIVCICQLGYPAIGLSFSGWSCQRWKPQPQETETARPQKLPPAPVKIHGTELLKPEFARWTKNSRREKKRHCGGSWIHKGFLDDKSSCSKLLTIISNDEKIVLNVVSHYVSESRFKSWLAWPWLSVRSLEIPQIYNWCWPRPRWFTSTLRQAATEMSGSGRKPWA